MGAVNVCEMTKLCNANAALLRQISLNMKPVGIFMQLCPIKKALHLTGWINCHQKSLLNTLTSKSTEHIDYRISHQRPLVYLTQQVRIPNKNSTNKMMRYVGFGTIIVTDKATSNGLFEQSIYRLSWTSLSNDSQGLIKLCLSVCNLQWVESEASV